MDASNDVIIGTAKGYGWQAIRTYAVSLAQSGFKGRKVLLCCDVTKTAREALTKLGFELYDYVSTAGNTVYERFRVLCDWAELQTDVRYIIHCDVRDVVIQGDPSPFMEKQSTKIWGATEFILYKDEFCNPEWIRKLYGEETLATLQNEEVVCAGTIAGEFETFKKMIARIYESCTDRFGDDQAALNVLLRSEFKDVMSIPTYRDGFIATIGWYLIGNANGNAEQFVGRRSLLVPTPPQLRDGVVYPHGSDRPFDIIHQYERGALWTSKIQQHYRDPFPVANDTVEVKAATKRKRGGQLKYAKDGLTLDWFDMHDIG